MGGRGSKSAPKKIEKNDVEQPKPAEAKKDEPKKADPPQQVVQEVKNKPEKPEKPEKPDEPPTEEEKKEIGAKVGKKKRRGSVIDELNALERTKSYNKIEEVAGALPEDVRVLTQRQKEELWGYYDKDKNGKMDMNEMRTVMRHLMRFRAKHATSQERKSIELRAMIMTPYQLEDFDELNMAKKVFDSLDINHDGHVVKDEFINKFNLDHEACKVS